MQHGAALAGVGADELEAHFTRFQKALSESAIGTGEARLAFAQLGLQIESMKDLDPVEAFGKFADALSRTGTAADKIRLVDAVMGRGGDRLIPLLSQGAEGIRKMTEEAAMLGPTSAASMAKVAESALSWRRVEEAVSGLGRTIAVELAPTFVSASQGIESVVSSIRELDLNRETFWILGGGPATRRRRSWRSSTRSGR